MMKYRTFARTTLEGGESHKKHNKPCQDRSDHFSGDGMYIAVVADGHGSDNCFRSEYGAEFAVKAAMDCIKTFITNLRGREFPTEDKLPTEDSLARQVREMAGAIVKNWTYRVSEHYRDYPIMEDDKEYTGKDGEKHFFPGLKRFGVDDTYRAYYLKEIQDNSEGARNSGGGFLDEDKQPVSRHAYGATLIAAAITKDYWFGIQIGDGKLTAVYPDGSFDQPVPWDDKCYLNVTTSICDDDAAERARVYVKKPNGKGAEGNALGKVQPPEHEDRRPLPAAILLNSDGVDDSFPVDKNMDHMVKKFYYPVLRMFTENETDPAKGWDASVKELGEFLPGLSKRGSGDDVSVAAIVDMDLIRAPLFQAALDKAKKEAEERRIKEQAEREEAARIAAEEEKKRQAEKEAKEKAAQAAAQPAKPVPATLTGRQPAPQPQPVRRPQQQQPSRQDAAPTVTACLQDPAVMDAAKRLRAIQEEAERAKSVLEQAVLQSSFRQNAAEESDIPSGEAKKPPPV